MNVIRSNLAQRICVAIPLGLAAVLCFANVYATTVLVAAVAAIAVIEADSVIYRSETENKNLSAQSLIVAVLLAFGIILLAVDYSIAAFLVLFIAVIATAGFNWHAGQNQKRFFWSIGSVVYVAAAAWCFVNLRIEHGFLPALWVGVVVVTTDTAAMGVGKFIGGRKLWSRISPNKTWAGLLGAMFFAGVAGWIFSWATDDTHVKFVVPASVLGALVSQAGDLLESYGKRTFGADDSGTILPGHGGLLDRVDGFLAVSVIALLVSAYLERPLYVW